MTQEVKKDEDNIDLRKDVEKGLDKPAEEVIDEVVVSPKMEQAMSQGWRPKEEFEGDPEDWVDHTEFLRRGELFKSLHKANRKVKDLEKTVHDLAEHNRKVEEKAYERAIQELKAERREAMKENDFDRADAIDDKIDEVREKKLDSTKSTTTTQSNEAFESFVDRNPWYVTNDEMREWADTYGMSYAQRNRDKPLEEIYEHIEKEVKARFDTPSKTASKAKAPKVNDPESNTRKASGGKKTYTINDLTPEQRTVVQRFTRNGGITEADYIKQLAESGELS